jgi:hypothetical protein
MKINLYKQQNQILSTSNFLAAFLILVNSVAFCTSPVKESRKWRAAFNCESVNTHRRSFKIKTRREPMTKQSAKIVLKKDINLIFLFQQSYISPQKLLPYQYSRLVNITISVVKHKGKCSLAEILMKMNPNFKIFCIKTLYMLMAL